MSLWGGIPRHEEFLHRTRQQTVNRHASQGDDDRTKQCFPQSDKLKDQHASEQQEGRQYDGM